ncbi:54S ribosomal protein L16, mitochondrial [Mycena sanguinolenta]|uniref:54S ribosomal protein L16, mitochondrial n=1 Tax=Mycena sanguinolenta TaxID=230812 RepID=A0A8H6XTA4_9AGAR|nr:54S ribosomal protein L16, mitochondrial [Mycena sanguinolenta]
MTHPTMDTKIPLQFEDLPSPGLAHRRGILQAQALQETQTLLWFGARYFQINLREPSESVAFIEDHPHPLPPDMVVDHCEEWSDIGDTDPDVMVDRDIDFPHYADASFELPVSADTLFLISRNSNPRHRRGVYAGGHVSYVQSEEVSDSVKVDITAYFWHEKILGSSKACLLKRDEDQTGVGIFTRSDGKDHRHRRRSEHERLRFDVTVTFPSTEDGSSLAINRFFTDLEIFAQTFADFSHVNFGKLQLKSVIGGLHAESLSAGNASINTAVGSVKIQSLVAPEAFISNAMGPIEGTYNGSKLTLTTSNGAINVDVNLHNDDDDAAQLKMHTTNGPIQGNVNLLSSKEDPASFNIAARTAHGRVGVDVLSAPLNSNITLQATTAIGAAEISLPPSYEGAFSGSTSLGSVDIAADGEVEDPAGEDRERKIEFSEVGRNRKVGRVGWSDEGMARGKVSVVTSMAPVRIQF